MERFIKLADIRKLNKQVSLGDISSSRMVEIINEKAIEFAKMHVENFKIEQALKLAIQDRQSVLKEVEQAFKTTGVFHSQYWLNRIQSLTQQIEYFKSKL